MRLLTGPAGSGKTQTILQELRTALRAEAGASVRLLVPTATLAQHAQNQLAREGFVFSHRVVQTLNGFIAEWAADEPEVSDAVFYLLVENAARRVNRAEFADVVEFPGFSSALARTIRELSAAGCDSERLAAHLPDAPLAAPFLAIYQELERELERRGQALRARRLELAARRIAEDGVGRVSTVWLDGFYALPEPELGVIAALAKHARVTVALSDYAAQGVDRDLERLGCVTERLAGRRIRPATIVVKAANIERETEAIARRILEHAAGGRAFREIGVILRSPENYLPILRSTFARFGIPARFYFPQKLAEHAVARFLRGTMEALLSGWDHEITLRALRLAPRLTDWNAVDRFDFAVREKIPNRGLKALQELAGEADGLQELLAGLANLEEWRTLELAPGDWAKRFEILRRLFRPARPNHAADHDLALIYRGQAEALNGFDEAVSAAAEALEAAAPVSLAVFWRSVESALRLKALRVRDGRRNTVQVLSAHEARQWTLQVVFICGLTERQFPQFHRPDAFLPETARQRLDLAGIRVRTAAGFEAEEMALFQAAVSRGTSQVVLSYPEFDERGERNLLSIFLADLHLPADSCRPARPRPVAPYLLPARAAIASAALLAYLKEHTAHLSPSALESYLQCAFQYFGTKTLRLKTAPKRPERRLHENYLLQGNIVHEALRAAYATPERMEEAFEHAFENERTKLNIPNGYHTERLRNRMREDLLAFVRDETWPRQLFSSRAEEPFEFELSQDLKIRGKIDRIDEAAGGNSYVIDYKYSAANRIKGRLDDPNLMQAPLYYMAARKQFGLNPDGMFYIGLKKTVEYVGWSYSGFMGSQPIPDDWLETARTRTLQLAAEIRAGRIEVAPFDRDNCRFCDCKDVCRVTTEQGAAIQVEGAAAAGTE